MTIEQIDNSKVLISLCTEDMADFSLQFGKMSFHDSHSRIILSRLLSIACTKTGLAVEDKSLLVEALPHQNGCLLLITAVPKRTKRKIYKIKKSASLPCYCFKNAENLLSAIEKLNGGNSFYCGNCAYLYKDKYFIVFDYPALSIKTKMILSEFSTVCTGSKSFIARVKEAGKLLADVNAVEQIGNRLKKK